MPPKRHNVSTSKGILPANFYFPKPLCSLGWGSLLILWSLSNLAADDPLATPGAVSSNTAGDNSSAAPASGAANNSQNPNTPQVPDNSQTTSNGPPQYTPLLPQQGGNPYSVFSPYSTDPQSPQVTAPSLYNTGTTDLSQVGTNTALSQVFANESGAGFLSEPNTGYSYPPIERVQLGPIDLKAAAVATVISDDNLRTGNLQSNGTQMKETDTYYAVTPAVLLEYGNHEGQKGYASLVYAPTITRFLHYSAQDSDDQNVSLTLRYPFQRLSLDATETYAQVSGFNEDLNARTTQTSNLATFGGSYEIDDKLAVTSHIQQVISSFSQPGGQQASTTNASQGDTTTSINSTVLYHLSDKMTLSPSANFGIDKPDGMKQQTFEQALMGATYQPTTKISLAAQGGVEFRQGVQNGQNANGPSGDETNPIFSDELGYTPFDSTTLAVTASQSVRTSSADTEQNVVDTSVGFSATQRFLQRFFLNLSFGYSHTEDQSGTGNVTSNNTNLANSVQDTFTYRPSLSVAPTAWSSVAIYYQYLDNRSNISTETYHDNQVGISISAQF